MGEVICVYRIMPESPEAFESVKNSLEELKPDRLEEEPLAFGLKAIKFTKIIQDAPGALEELEEKINSIKGIGSVENIMTSRSL